MRIWSIHPKYLSDKKLIELWKNCLVAQRVFSAPSNDFIHRQLLRFLGSNDPLEAIGAYLIEIYEESEKRNLDFNKDKILKPNKSNKLIKIPKGQMVYEITKLNNFYAKNGEKVELNLFPEPHPLFRVVEGELAYWENDLKK